MENDNYEQDFIKNVRETNRVASPTSKPVSAADGASKLPLIISIVLASIVFVESIALVIFAVNFGEALDLYGEDETETDYVSSEDSPDDLSNGSIYNLDDDYKITSFDLVCTTDDGAKYSFTKAGNYEKTDSSSNVVDSGSYSIINDGAVVLGDGNTNTDKKKVVYYDGVYIMEDITFYTCDNEE